MSNQQEIIINERAFRDKVMGCWLGKNAGGTLGEPLEEKFGREEMFNVSWYTDLPEGGIPNDDLEIQLIWLQALQEKGPGLNARDLAEYWLDCIAYHFDEYGLSKTNLMKGLVPPVSGWHNNWFKDCMGSPIRSEIWACVAPGAPEIAARYAFQDAICDHAGGESVYGEVFNAVVESAAFLIPDKMQLIETGLRSIPEQTQTFQAIQYASELYGKGVDWKEARERVKRKFYHPVAQHSPINLGFQIIGWLYGEDFGDSICKAVNCGWDTDCTGATVGALQGIVLGAEKLPKSWMAPLSDRISTNLGSGGIKNLNVPTDIHELTDQVCAMARRVLKFWNTNIRIVDEEYSLVEAECIEIDSANKLADYEPDVAEYDLNTLKVSIKYKRSAAITAAAPAKFAVRIHNPHPEPMQVTLSIDLPERWRIELSDSNRSGNAGMGSGGDCAGLIELDIAARDQEELHYSLYAPAGKIEERNVLYARLSVKERPVLPAVPIVYLGGSKWLASPIFEGKTLEEDCGVLNQELYRDRPSDWREFWCEDNNLNVESLFAGKSGTVYVLHHLWSEAEQDVVIGVPNSGRMQLWLNGQFLHQTRNVVPLRPNQGNGGALGDGSNYVNTALQSGWNQILIKFERKHHPLDAHVTLGTLHPQFPKNHGGAVMNMNRSRFSWEE